jgi:hypothetical protein
MHSGGVQGFSFQTLVSHVLWLMILNPIWLGLALWGWWKHDGKELTIIKAQIIGLLPLLVQYGGRFFMQGSPFFAPFIALNFTRFFHGEVTRRRLLGFVCLTLIPLPCINFMGPNDTIRLTPFPGITATHVSLYLFVARESNDRREYEALARVIRETTDPDVILHLPDTHPHFANYLTVKTGRRTDAGGWGEVSKMEMWEAVMQSRKNHTENVFIATKKESIPSERDIQKAGNFYIGYPALDN